MSEGVTLTGPQRRILAVLYLRNRRRMPKATAVLRVLEERGLVRRNSHNEWSITDAGRAVLIETEEPKS